MGANGPGMLIGHTSDAAAAGALARASACELFVEPDGDRCHLAIVDSAPTDARGWSFTPVQTLFEGGRQGRAAGEWLFEVGLRVPAEARGEFLAWYHDEHLPILLECATWDGCRFVEAAAGRDCQFFALHQLTERAALASPERARSRATPWFTRLKRHAWFDEPFTRTLYRRVDTPA